MITFLQKLQLGLNVQRRLKFSHLHSTFAFTENRFICKFGSQFYHQTLIVKHFTLQISIKQAMITSKLYRKFLGSLINACGSLFVGSPVFLYDLNKGKP